MTLICRLFKGDAKLEACLVNDAAHVTRGAAGAHVAKIQFALFALDSLKIDPRELSSNTYGPSTAKAVLAYKTKRKIINYSYQSRPDDIVGKMTIASLDKEMSVQERSRTAHCLCPSGDHIQAVSANSVSAGLPGSERAVAAGLRAEGRKPPKHNVLRIYWSVTRAGQKKSSRFELQYLDRANEILSEYGMVIDNLFCYSRSYSDVIPNDDVVYINDDALRIRKASEDLRPGLSGILRVISCPFIDVSPDFGVTLDGVVGSLKFPYFIAINVNKVRSDRVTLLHEMIHAATGATVHDKEDYSVFGEGSNRHWLRPEHAESLSKSFFSL